MIDFPHAKVNIGLQILRKRPDGFHDIVSCLYPIPWCDALEIIENESFEFSQSGLPIQGTAEDNLCVRAYQEINKIHPLPALHIHLLKQIPMGAGLGGGSADATFTLRLLNNFFNLNLPKSTLASIASKLGSDCPFFLAKKAQIATGTGTSLKEIDLDLSGYFLGIVKPDIHISTARAYADVTPNNDQPSLEDVLSGDIRYWKNTVKNDFEDSLFPEFPLLDEIKSWFYEQGAIYASLSGSGSAIFGLFASKPTGYEKLDFLAKL